MSQESTISTSDVTTTIATSTSTNVTTTTNTTIGDSNIELSDINLHLGNIEATSRMILTLLVLVVTFKALYYLVDKVFFNGV